MIEIINEKYKIAEFFINNMSCIYFCCVLEGTMEGRVWVNTLEKPSFAIVWNEYQKGFQMMGAPIKQREYIDFRLFFDTVIIQMLRKKGIDCFECGTDSEELTKMLFDLFKDKSIDSEQQKVFHFSHLLDLKEELLNSVCQRYDMVEIDASFLEMNYENLEYVTNELIDTWGCAGAYLEKGYGYAAVMDNRIVGRVLVTCSYEQVDNIGADVDNSHRRRGIATILAYLTIQEAANRDRKIIWDCMEENVASAGTALKVGFNLDRTYTVCWFYI